MRLFANEHYKFRDDLKRSLDKEKIASDLHNSLWQPVVAIDDNAMYDFVYEWMDGAAVGLSVYLEKIKENGDLDSESRRLEILNSLIANQAIMKKRCTLVERVICDMRQMKAENPLYTSEQYEIIDQKFSLFDPSVFDLNLLRYELKAVEIEMDVVEYIFHKLLADDLEAEERELILEAFLEGLEAFG